MIQSLIPEYGDRAEITIVDSVLEQANDVAQKLISDQKVDVFLSAGANGMYLRDTTELPVVRIPVTGVDLMRALLKARHMSDQVAVVTYEQTNSELEEIKDLVNVNIEQRCYTTIEDAKETFTELAHRGFRVIVGSSLITELAERQGLIGILVYSRNSIRNTIEDAIEIAHIRFAEEQRVERMNAILGHLNEGVIAVDAEERVQLLNPAMENLTGLSASDVQGKRLAPLLPQLSLGETIKSGRSSLERIEKLKNKQTIVTNRIPIRSNGTVSGAVLTIQDAQSFSRVDRNIRSRNRRIKFMAHYDFSSIVGKSPRIEEARELCKQYAETDATVLLTGDTGTGKELFAQSIHNASSRRNAPFVAVNCAAIPDSLLESELFGYEEGAFTDSRKGGQTGLFELAHTGTIFLDEIAEMPAVLQTRLLRVLQEKVVLPLGGDPVPVDVRVIAASNRELEEAIADGTLRKDLYYRLNILHVELPPLQARGDDVILLANELLRLKFIELGKEQETEPLIESIEAPLRAYDWPGNVRELENVVERIAVLWVHCGSFNKQQLENRLRSIAPELFRAPQAPSPDTANSLKEFVERTEYQRICDTVEECRGNLSEAAKQLQLSRTTLWRKLRRFNDDGHPQHP